VNRPSSILHPKRIQRRDAETSPGLKVHQDDRRRFFGLTPSE